MEQVVHYDAIVLGAGPGGSTIAGLLASRKKKVLVIDKNAGAGGKMMTIHRNGHAYELFPLNLMPFGPSLFEKLEEETGKDVRNIAVEFTGDDSVGLIYRKRDGKAVQINMRKPTGFLKCGVKLWELPKVGKVFKNLMTMTPEEIKKLEKISALDYMESLKLPEAFTVLITAIFGEGAFEMTADAVPASHMVRMLQYAMGGKHSTPRYYEGGIGGFFDRILETVPENGGKLLWKTRVKRVVIEDGKAVGVETEDGDIYRAPVIISNAGIRQTVVKLVGEDQFPKEYSERIKGLRSNLADIGYRYFTNEPVMTKTTYVLFPWNCLHPWSFFEEMAEGKKKPEGNYVYMGSKSLYPTVSPEGKQVIYACMSCTPDPEQDVQPYLDYVDGVMHEFFPKLFEPGVLESREVMTLESVHKMGVDKIFPGEGGESYGCANAIGQADDDMPRCKTPLEGLYIVGNDAEGYGVGTHRAVDSGFRLFNHFAEDGFVKGGVIVDELI